MPYTGKYRVRQGHLSLFGFKIARADVADFMIKAAENSSWVGKIAGISNSSERTKDDPLFGWFSFAHIHRCWPCSLLELGGALVFRLRRACTLSEARLWIERVPSLSRIVLASLLVILLTGVYLTIRMSGFGLMIPLARTRTTIANVLADKAGVTRGARVSLRVADDTDVVRWGCCCKSGK